MMTKFMGLMLSVGLLLSFAACGRAKPTVSGVVGRWGGGLAELELRADLTFSCANWPENQAGGGRGGGSGSWSIQDYDGPRVFLNFKELAGAPAKYALYLTPESRQGQETLEYEAPGGTFQFWRR